MTKEALASPKDAALKLALEALEPDVYRAEWAVEQDREKAITAIKAALAQPTSGDYAHGYVEGFNDACMPKPAQPEQEPVAWATRMGEYAHIHWGAKRPEYPMVYEAPLYTTPPASVNEAPQEQQSCDRRTWGKPWVSLTDEEQQQAYEQWQNDGWGVFYKAIEAKLKAKNGFPQQEKNT